MDIIPIYLFGIEWNTDLLIKIQYILPIKHRNNMSKISYNKGINNPMYGRKGKNHPGWKGGISNNRDYIIIYKPDHPYCDSKGYIPEQRLVLEYYYTILLDYIVFINPKIYDIHHIDGDKRNNNYWNLELLTKSEHTILHNIIDHSKTICLLCGSNKTSKIKTRGNIRPHWYTYKNGYICDKCYRREYHKLKKME